jgi:low temperature requirement protein LtrA
LPISGPIVVASILGLTVAACLWWAYFDVVAIAAERMLRETHDEDRARMARDAYSYLHLPMIAGVILVSLGLEQVLEYVGDASHHTLRDALAWLPLSAMYGGVALYLLAHVAFKFRTWHKVSVPRLVVACVVLSSIPLAAQLMALAALALLAAILVSLIAFETLTFSDVREQVRHEDDPSPAAHAGDRDQPSAAPRT